LFWPGVSTSTIQYCRSYKAPTIDAEDIQRKDARCNEVSWEDKLTKPLSHKSHGEESGTFYLMIMSLIAQPLTEKTSPNAGPVLDIERLRSILRWMTGDISDAYFIAKLGRQKTITS